MNVKRRTRAGIALVTALLGVAVAAPPASATIAGLKSAAMGTTFNFTAKVGYITFADGGSVPFWGLANTDPLPAGIIGAPAGQVQFPGPTLIVNEGETITINLSNELPEPISLIFPGLGAPEQPVYASPGDRATLRSFAHETPAGGPGAPSAVVTYTFTASRPGTFTYESGTNMAKQTYMGLFGAIIVRPAGYTEVNQGGNDQWTLTDPADPTNLPAGAQHPEDLTRHAYGSGDPDSGGDATAQATAYQREYLLLFHEIDPRINNAIATGHEPDFSDWHPVYWTVNGRALPDCLFPHAVPWLPSQPYGALNFVHPGEQALARFIDMGRDPHPFHTHTNDILVIAHDGHPLQSDPTQGVDRAQFINTLSAYPGQTDDALWKWTGAALDWDVYGHAPGDPLAPFEYAGDHGKAFPTTVPDPNNTTFGGFWSGSPFLGGAGALPPGEGGLNPWNGYVAIWHSHAEKELTNDDIFPGGILTFMVVVPYLDDTGAVIPVTY